VHTQVQSNRKRALLGAAGNGSLANEIRNNFFPAF